MFRLSFREKALREFANVLRKDQLRINSALDELQAERWKTLNLRKIKGTTHGYRLRVGQVAYFVYNDTRKEKHRDCGYFYEERGSGL